MEAERVPQLLGMRALCVYSDTLVVSAEGEQGFVDLTERVTACIAESRIAYGLVNVQVRHTSAALLVNENEPLLLGDLERLLERLAPRGAAYDHDRFDLRTPHLAPDERANGHAHSRAVLLRTSECLNLVDGALQLGRWQRLFLVELDGVREREVSVLVMGLGHGPRAPLRALAPA